MVPRSYTRAATLNCRDLWSRLSHPCHFSPRSNDAQQRVQRSQSLTTATLSVRGTDPARLALSRKTSRWVTDQMGHSTSFQRRYSGIYGIPRLRPMHSSSARGYSSSVEGATPARDDLKRQLLSETPMTVLEGREWLRHNMQPEALRIAGVTFDGRQELIAKLQPDQALMLQKDPHNEYDPNAIKVMTLS
ncbi:hypothetical protein COCSUDRAFT_53046, partial [Coccomyxa subellipsoidea C-169]